MSKIQELLSDKIDQIDYDELVKTHPWIIEKSQKCILSPDSDGLLCGLFMSHFLDWGIKGFYDGKVLLIENGTQAKDCVFLDIEIFREGIKSVGHHMLQFNKEYKPQHWNAFANCIQPNNLRDYDASHNFRLKYPLATIHLLLAILGSQTEISIPESAICPLLFTDGTFNVLFKYPENVLNWLNFLRAGEEGSPLKSVFENELYSVFSLMKAMDSFFKRRDEINVPRERGDRLRISNPDSSPCNTTGRGRFYDIDLNAKGRVVAFIKILSSLTGWEYKKNKWAWSNLDLHKFTKSSFASDDMSLTIKNFETFYLKNPLSWAITGGNKVEYTLEYPDTLS